MAMGDRNLHHGQPATGDGPDDRSAPEDQKPQPPRKVEARVTKNNGQFCIECPCCGFGVVRSETYIRQLPNMKCPHCLTSYSVEIKK